MENLITRKTVVIVVAIVVVIAATVRQHKHKKLIRYWLSADIDIKI